MIPDNVLDIEDEKEESVEEKPRYTPYGAARDFWKCKDREVLLHGPADTGKTRVCLEKLHALCLKYPNCHAIIARRFRSDLKESSIFVLMEYVYENDPGKCGVTVVGGKNPREFHYANGSRIISKGLDEPQGTLGGAYDFAFVSQAEELNESQWNILASRVSGRAGNSPYPQLMADANPGPPYHFLMHRKSITPFKSRHIDNPEIYDQSTRRTLESGEVVADILETGAGRIETLEQLTGIEYERLFLGNWAAAQGRVYDDFDPDIHVCDPVEDGGERFLSIDFGFTNPFVCQWWHVDFDYRMTLTREIYHTGLLIEDVAEEIMNITWDAEEYISAVVCDHSAQERATLEKHFGTTTIPALKGRDSIVGGINLVKHRLKVAGDGKPRIQIASNALYYTDRSLMDAKRPLSTRDEFGAYLWKKKGARGSNESSYDDQTVDKDNHGMDAMRYAVLYMDHHEEIPIRVNYRRPFHISRF